MWQISQSADGQVITVRISVTALPRAITVRPDIDEQTVVSEWLRGRYFLVARDEEGPVGFVAADESKETNIIHIRAIAVDRPKRGAGIGSQLLQAIKDIAHGQRARMLVLESTTRNQPLLDFCLKRGFSLSGYRDYYFPNGETAVFLGAFV